MRLPMLRKKEKPQIENPKDKPLQVILTDCFQLGYVLETVLSFCGPSDITVSTFSTGEEFLRKLLALKRKGYIRHATLYTDTKAAEKTAKIKYMLNAAYDELHFCRNHSKVMVVEGKMNVVVLSSQNQTRGNRLESYVIVHDDSLSNKCKQALENLNNE